MTEQPLGPEHTGLAPQFNSERVGRWIKENALVIGTGNGPKFDDNQRGGDWYGIELYSGPDSIGGVDSEEDFRTYEEIVRDKERLLNEEYDDKTRAEQDETLRFLGVKSWDNVKTITEDRGSDWDLKVRDHPLCAHIWNDLKEHSDHLVREAFEAEHPFPGKRFNEVRAACGGTIKFLQRYHKCVDILKKADIDVEDTHVSHITYRYKGHKDDLALTPEQIAKMPDVEVNVDGDDLEILIHKSQPGYRFKRITPEIKKMAENRINPLDPHDLDIPPGETETISELWESEDSDFHDERFLPARAIKDLMAVLGLPRLTQPVKRHKIPLPEAKILSGLHLAQPDIYKYNKIAGHDAVSLPAPVETMEDFAEAFDKGQGVVFDKLPQINTGSGQERRERTLHKIMTILGATYYGTLGTLGAANAVGRPLLLHNSHMEEGGSMRFIRDLYEAGTVSKDPERMFSMFGDQAELKEILNEGWDPNKFRKTDHIEYNLQDKKWFEEFQKNKHNNRKYGISFLGSSVCREADINNNAKTLVYFASAMGAVIDHGGGTRGTMNEFFEGSVQAFLDGYTDFINRGFRTPVIKKEGTIKKKARSIADRLGIKLTGDVESDIFKIGKQFIISSDPTIIGRQHKTLGLSDAGVYNKPGSGTIFELAEDMLHNFLVEERGHGIRPDFYNDRPKLLVMMNAQGCYDPVLGNFDKEEQRMLNLHSDADYRLVFLRLLDHAGDLGYHTPQHLHGVTSIERALQNSSLAL